jgi:hypothetical protein
MGVMTVDILATLIFPQSISLWHQRTHSLGCPHELLFYFSLDFKGIQPAGWDPSWDGCSTYENEVKPQNTKRKL